MIITGCVVGAIMGVSLSWATSMSAGLAFGGGAIAIPTGVIVAPYAADAGCLAGMAGVTAYEALPSFEDFASFMAKGGEGWANYWRHYAGEDR